ncbi:MAG: hypothetical protein DSO04_02905 [Hadesarchaea archaeon]|nr:MAG: hypothetical protein DSO04_02905 [Hadesarchaea archaeon]
MAGNPEEFQNLNFDQVKELDEASWRLWTYLQFRNLDKKMGWIIKILLALVAAVFGLKLV